MGNSLRRVINADFLVGSIINMKKLTGRDILNAFGVRVIDHLTILKKQKTGFINLVKNAGLLAANTCGTN